MEKIIYGIIAIVGILVSYVFGRRNSNDRGTTVEQVRDTLDGAEQRLDASDKRTVDNIERVDNIETGLKQSVDRVDSVEEKLGNNTERLERSKERNIEIQDIVRELRQRAKNKTDGNDSD